MLIVFHLIVSHMLGFSGPDPIGDCLEISLINMMPLRKALKLADHNRFKFTNLQLHANTVSEAV